MAIKPNQIFTIYREMEQNMQIEIVSAMDLLFVFVQCLDHFTAKILYVFILFCFGF